MGLRELFGAVLLLMFVRGCATVGHNSPGIDNFDVVSGDLYRGAQPTAAGIRGLAAQNVRTVINLRDGDDAAEAREVREAGMTYIHMPLDAETVTAADAERFLTVLEGVPRPVFVHCLVGRDRTGMAVAAYRVRVQGWTQAAAIKDLYEHGHFWVFFPKVREAVAGLEPVGVTKTEIALSPPAP